MWIGGTEFGIGASYHVMSPDRDEHEGSSGLCVKNGGVDSMTQGPDHSILIINGILFASAKLPL
eukprot:1137807-Pelagomonas_calceolata.AAC.12